MIEFVTVYTPPSRFIPPEVFSVTTQRSNEPEFTPISTPQVPLLENVVETASTWAHKPPSPAPEFLSSVTFRRCTVGDDVPQSMPLPGVFDPLVAPETSRPSNVTFVPFFDSETIGP